MKTVFIVASLLVCCAVYSQQQESPLCPVNMVYKECGSACPPACDVVEPQFCIALCVPGCYCKDGYILIARNSSCCIPEKDCPKCF